MIFAQQKKRASMDIPTCIIICSGNLQCCLSFFLHNKKVITIPTINNPMAIGKAIIATLTMDNGFPRTDNKIYKI